MPKPTHFTADFIGSVGYVLAMLRETVRGLPAIWKLRSLYRHRTPTDQPHVVLVGDNMDSVHGISVSSMRMVRDLRKLGHRATLLGISHSKSLPGNRDPEGAAWMIPASTVQDLFGYEGQELAFPDLRALATFLSQEPVDVIELESPGTFPLVFAVLARVLGIPVVHNYRTDLISYFKMLLGNPIFIDFLTEYVRGFLKSGGHVIVPSRAFLEVVVDLGLPRSQVCHLPRGVDLSRFHPDKAKAGMWASLGAPEGPVIAFLGRVSREKGLDVLEAAFRLVLQKHPSAVLGVIGDGPYRAQFAQNLSDTNRAFFAGETTGERLPALLASAHVFAFPSTTDTFGNAVLEALASGIPAVVTDQGGPCEIVEDGASGFVIAGHDPVLLAEKLVWLLDHPEQCRTMGQNAWERAQQFRPEIATQRHWEFYQKVAQERLS